MFMFGDRHIRILVQRYNAEYDKANTASKLFW